MISKVPEHFCIYFQLLDMNWCLDDIVYNLRPKSLYRPFSGFWGTTFSSAHMQRYCWVLCNFSLDGINEVTISFLSHFAAAWLPLDDLASYILDIVDSVRKTHQLCGGCCNSWFVNETSLILFVVCPFVKPFSMIFLNQIHFVLHLVASYLM